MREEPQMMVFTIPIFEPLPSQYYVKVVSDRWIGSTNVFPISFQHLILPEKHPPHTSEFLAFILFNTHLSRNMKKLNKVFNHWWVSQLLIFFFFSFFWQWVEIINNQNNSKKILRHLFSIMWLFGAFETTTNND